MTTQRDDGGPAFPHVGEQFSHDIGGREIVTTADGLTMRDYFAAKAMAAIIQTWPHITDGGPRNEEELLTLTASDAYRFADAMLKERKV